jgi:hypothetical protein
VAPTPSGTPIYRGIHVGHHAWADALRGIASPADPEGHEDVDAHNAGGTRKSRLTSWTHDRSVAVARAGPGGLLLEWMTGMAPPDAGWHFLGSPDLFDEQEVLVSGTLVGVWVTQL